MLTSSKTLLSDRRPRQLCIISSEQRGMQRQAVDATAADSRRLSIVTRARVRTIARLLAASFSTRTHAQYDYLQSSKRRTNWKPLHGDVLRRKILQLIYYLYYFICFYSFVYECVCVCVCDSFRPVPLSRAHEDTMSNATRFFCWL